VSRKNDSASKASSLTKTRGGGEEGKKPRKKKTKYIAHQRIKWSPARTCTGCKEGTKLKGGKEQHSVWVYSLIRKWGDIRKKKGINDGGGTSQVLSKGSFPNGQKEPDAAETASARSKLMEDRRATPFHVRAAPRAGGKKF